MGSRRPQPLVLSRSSVRFPEMVLPLWYLSHLPMVPHKKVSKQLVSIYQVRLWFSRSPSASINHKSSSAPSTAFRSSCVAQAGYLLRARSTTYPGSLLASSRNFWCEGDILDGGPSITVSFVYLSAPCAVLHPYSRTFSSNFNVKMCSRLRWTRELPLGPS